jgi:O-methyltransferase
MQMTAQQVFEMLPRVRNKAITGTPDPAFPHAVVVPFATYAPWMGDPAFLRLYGQVREHTLVDLYRCWELWQLVPQLASLSGDILEVGVWRGGTGCLMAHRASEAGARKRVHLCGTFGAGKAGRAATTDRGGEHADTSVDQVRALMKATGAGNVELHKGMFPEETGAALEGLEFSLCHIDVDAYQSAGDVLDWVWPRLQVGGVVVFDDYGFYGCEGVTRLVAERAATPGCLTLHNLNGHAVMLKTQATAASPAPRAKKPRARKK